MWFTAFCLLITIFTNGECSKDRQPQSSSDATKYLINYGYMSNGGMLGASQTSAKNIEDARAALRKAIVKFQEFAGLPKTGELDDKTLSKMAQPRCGLQDVFAIRSGVPQKWNKNIIRYSIDSYSFDMPPDNIRRAMANSFNVWSKVIPINFEENAGHGDIRIKFESKRHGDPWPFDGKGGVLAHATLPPSGILHFDEDENWVYMDKEKISRYDYTDLLSVAIHEIGHALGLEHSNAVGSIMVPFYQESVDKYGNYITPELHSDDIAKIQDLYGSRPFQADKTTKQPVPSSEIAPKKNFWDRVKGFLGFGNNPSDHTTISQATSTTPLAPITKPIHVDGFNDCPHDLDAAITAYGKMYLFSGSKVFEVNKQKVQAVHSLKQMFPNSPPYVQGAIFAAESNGILLFHSKRVYFYERDKSGKFVISPAYPKRLPLSLQFNPMGAFVWIDNRKILVNGHDFAIYDENWNQVTMQNKIPNYFSGFPNEPIRGVINDNGIKIFTNDHIYLYDAIRHKISGPTALRNYLHC